MIVIGLTGFFQVGKTTAAQRLVAHHGFQRGRFAGALKHMLRALLLYRGAPEEEIARMLDGDLKEVPSRWLNGSTPRHAMEELGTGWGRVSMSPSLWVDTERDHLLAYGAARVVFEDCRFINEADAIRAMGGLVVRVTRPGVVASSLPTDVAQQAITPDREIANDADVAALYAKIDALVTEIAR